MTLCVKRNERVNSGKLRSRDNVRVNLAPLVTRSRQAQHGGMILRDITWLYVNFN